MNRALQTVRMKHGHVEVGHRGVTSLLSHSRYHGIAPRVNAINMEPILFHLRMKLKWNGFIISWTGIKVQAAGDTIGMDSMICSKLVDSNGSQHLITSPNINSIILALMLICTINLDGVHSRYFQIICPLIMAMRENGTKKNAKKQKD